MTISKPFLDDFPSGEGDVGGTTGDDVTVVGVGLTDGTEIGDRFSCNGSDIEFSLREEDFVVNWSYLC